jgi:hypothetical protein
MQYFNTLPKIVQFDDKGVARLYTNLLVRGNIIPEFLKNPAIYYKYDIQEGDTPEIIAHKYYGDSYRYWIVLFANQLMDPQWDWPMSGTVFENYLVAKYGQSFNTHSEIHDYQKVSTQFDSGTNTTTVESVELSVEDYNSLVETTETYSLPTGDVTVSITKNAVSYYDYEYNLNESKRTIRILNSSYVAQMENEFKRLMTL